MTADNMCMRYYRYEVCVHRNEETLKDGCVKVVVRTLGFE